MKILSRRLITKDDLTKITRTVSRFGYEVEISPLPYINNYGLLADKDTVVTEDQLIEFSGNLRYNDVGKGLFIKHPDQTATVDNGVVIEVNHLKYLRIFDTVVYLDWFGYNIVNILQAFKYGRLELQANQVYQIDVKETMYVDIASSVELIGNGATIIFSNENNLKELLHFSFTKQVDFFKVQKLNITCNVAPFTFTNSNLCTYLDCLSFTNYTNGIKPDTDELVFLNKDYTLNGLKTFTAPAYYDNEQSIQEDNILLANRNIGNFTEEGCLLGGDNVITGNNTFAKLPTVPDATDDNHLVNLRQAKDIINESTLNQEFVDTYQNEFYNSIITMIKEAI